MDIPSRMDYKEVTGYLSETYELSSTRPELTSDGNLRNFKWGWGRVNIKQFFTEGEVNNYFR